MIHYIAVDWEGKHWPIEHETITCQFPLGSGDPFESVCRAVKGVIFVRIGFPGYPAPKGMRAWMPWEDLTK